MGIGMRAGTGLSFLIGGLVMIATADTGAAAHPALAGEWGGPQVHVSLGETGGRIDFACASATIDSAVHLDTGGKFSATGRHEEFAGGPTQADTTPPTTPARYSGQVDGDTLQLSVLRQGHAAETYTLQRGRRTKLIRCY
jgi:hypothetical protein